MHDGNGCVTAVPAFALLTNSLSSKELYLSYIRNEPLTVAWLPRRMQFVCSVSYAEAEYEGLCCVNGSGPTGTSFLSARSIKFNRRGSSSMLSLKSDSITGSGCRPSQPFRTGVRIHPDGRGAKFNSIAYGTASADTIPGNILSSKIFAEFFDDKH